MFTATEVGVNLAWEDRILGDVCLAGVVIEWKQEKPYYADYNAYG